MFSLLRQFSHMILQSISIIIFSLISSYLLFTSNLMAILTSVLAKQSPDQSPNISSPYQNNSQQVHIITSPWHNNPRPASSRSCHRPERRFIASESMARRPPLLPGLQRLPPFVVVADAARVAPTRGSQTPPSPEK